MRDIAQGAVSPAESSADPVGDLATNGPLGVVDADQSDDGGPFRTLPGSRRHSSECREKMVAVETLEHGEFTIRDFRADDELVANDRGEEGFDDRTDSCRSSMCR